MMKKAQESKIIRNIVIWVSINVGNLPLFDAEVSIEAIADTTSPPAACKNVGFYALGNLCSSGAHSCMATTAQ